MPFTTPIHTAYWLVGRQTVRPIRIVWIFLSKKEKHSLIIFSRKRFEKRGQSVVHTVEFSAKISLFRSYAFTHRAFSHPIFSKSLTGVATRVFGNAGARPSVRQSIVATPAWPGRQIQSSGGLGRHISVRRRRDSMLIGRDRRLISIQSGRDARALAWSSASCSQRHHTAMAWQAPFGNYAFASVA